jgi:hypothetical protein
MGDDVAEKKPRTRMTADELLEETSSALTRAINMLEANGLNAASAQHLRQIGSTAAWSDALSLTQDLGLTMPYLDHHALFAALLDCWECVAQIKLNARRNCYRKVRVLEADQKTDPEVLARWLTDRARTDNESAITNIACVRMKHILKASAAEGSSALVGTAQQ